MASLQTKVPWYVAVLVIAGFVALILFMNPPPAQEAPRRTACMNNVRQIGLAIDQYAGEHDGKYPDSFEILLKKAHLTTTKVLICPSTHDRVPGETYPEDLREASLEELKLADHNCSYTMIGGLKQEDLSDDFILIHDKSADNHDGEGRNCWLVKCEVKWLTEDEFQGRMRAQEARLRELRKQDSE